MIAWHIFQYNDTITTPERLLAALEKNTFPEMQEKYKTVARELLENKLIDRATNQPIELSDDTRKSLNQIVDPQAETDNPEYTLNNSSTLFSKETNSPQAPVVDLTDDTTHQEPVTSTPKLSES